jgi:hypothetical protein
LSFQYSFWLTHYHFFQDLLLTQLASIMLAMSKWLEHRPGDG